MVEKEQIVRWVLKVGRAKRGKVDYLRFLDGGRMTPSASISAKCYDCMGYYQDGELDCEVEECPLYPYMPYSSKPKAKQGRKGGFGNGEKPAEDMPGVRGGD